MGRKGQGHKPKHVPKRNNQNQLTNDDKELIINVDKLLRISTIPQQINVLKALENQREISAITEKINNLEVNKVSNASVDNSETGGNRVSGATVDAFTKWFKENGALLQGCSIWEFEGYDLGLKANVDIPQSSLVIAVPRKIMMSTETAQKGMLKDLMQKVDVLKNMPNVLLAMFLLTEKFKQNSFWKPYINILPKTYNTVLYFTVEELEELKGSPTLEIALKQNKSIARQYAYFHKLFATTENGVSLLMREKFTFKEYCWAVSTVMTRQNMIPSEDGTQMINALIPLWDLCNHTNGTITTDYNPALDRSECLALTDFKKDEQLFIFYGARTNADFFIHNGFVYEQNENDGYWIRLGVSKSDPLQEKRNELLSKLSIPTTGDFFITKGSRPIDDKLLAFLRIFNMTEEQLVHWLESDKSLDLQYTDCALDTALERKSWQFLRARLQLLLSCYKTTLEEDLTLMQDVRNMSENRALAIKMRSSEKKILRHALEYVEHFLEK